MTRPLPDVDDPEFAPFWAGTRDGELRVVFCLDCGEARWPPRPVCRRCRGLEFDWRAVPMTGTLHTWTLVERQTVPALPPPYVVGLITLDAHPHIRMLGNVVDVDPGQLRVDMPMTATFCVVDQAVTLVNWAPMSD